MFSTNFISWYPEISDPFFGAKINSMEEFLENVLESEVEQLSKVPGTLLKHQVFVSRYLSSITPYDGLLLFHEMGTGKTCSAVATIELIRQQNPTQFRGALILTRGTGLINNFVNELAFKCTDGRYLPKEPDLNPKIFRLRTKKKIEEFYTFETFERFFKNIRDVSSDIIKKRFEKFVIVVDEVHNIRDKTQDVCVYDSLHRFLHTLEKKKVILLSGTPMKDGCEEIASVMNLILPNTSQLPTDHKFLETFFDGDKLQNVEILKKSFRGRVSFLKSKISSVEKIEVGVVHEEHRFLKTTLLEPSAFQKECCAKAWEIDMHASNIYTHSRQASLFVFPDGSYGKKGFKNWYKKSNFWQGLKHTSVEETLKNISTFSEKYATVLRKCIEASANHQVSFVYSDIVNGSGLLILAKLLEVCGFSRRIREPKAFVLFTSALTEGEKSGILKICNSPENWDGSQVSIILGSRVMMEGFTLNHIWHEHILTPHWNYSETSQIIARGWRLGSHVEIENRRLRPVVNVYKYVLNVPNSIDVLMYKISEKKDVAIKKITGVLQESAVDCFLNKKRNQVFNFDNQRECHYGPCAYKCDSEEILPKTFTNFERFYFVNSSRWDAELVMLKKIFLAFHSVKIFEICEPTYLALSVLVYCKENGTQFVNPVGKIGYLQIRKDTLFLTTVPRGQVRCDDFPSLPKTNFESVVNMATCFAHSQLLKNFLTRKMSKESTFETIESFPSNIQKLLLEKCCKSKIEGKNKRVVIRDIVLEYFFTLYTLTNNSFGLFFTNPSFFTLSNKVWKKASSSEIANVLEKRKQDLLPIHKNDKGYYGQENKHINEFCIRQVGEETLSDKRKIQSGRRCINWNKKDLVQLSKTLLGSENWEEKSRGEMCMLLKKWFQANNLIEQDLTCGLQTKKKDFTKFSGI
jgi:hypothetical protein